MDKWRGQAVWVMSLGVCLALVLELVGAAEEVPSWPAFRGDAARTGFQPAETSLQPPLKVDWIALRGDSFLPDVNLIIESSPVIANGKVYVATIWQDPFVARLDLATGAVEWTFPLPAAVADENGVWSTLAVAGGKVYVAAFDGKLYCLDAETGGLLWDRQLAPASELRSMYASPVVYAGRVYIAPRVWGPTNLFCVDAENGALLSAVPLHGSLFASPTIGQQMLFLIVQLPYQDAYRSRLEAYDVSNPSLPIQSGARRSRRTGAPARPSTLRAR